MVRTSHKHYCAEKGEKKMLFKNKNKNFYSVRVDSYFLCQFKLTLIHHLQALKDLGNVPKNPNVEDPGDGHT